jgi:tRNA modification GTPase
VRECASRVEQLGVDRAFGAIAEADLVLLVIDGSCRREGEDNALRSKLEGLATIVVANKADLAPAWEEGEILSFSAGWDAVMVSARTGAGIPDLRARMVARLIGDPAVLREGMLVTNLRHCRCLEGAEARMEGAAGALRAGMSEEFVLADLHSSLKRIGEITGETTVDDLLGEIFSRFCIGK